MEKKTEKNSYTIIFAIAMIVLVGVALAYTSERLKSQITKNKQLEIKQEILYAMGVNNNSDKERVVFIPENGVAKAFSSYIKQQFVIQGEGATKATEDDHAYLIDIKKEETRAKADAHYTRKLPLFVATKDGETFYIVPVKGKGLWGAIGGYIALNKALVVQGVYFYHKQETPGLGGNMNKRFFMDVFKGEKIMKGTTFKSIAVVKGNNDPINSRKDDYKVDALTGATITSNGITAMLRKGLSMYIPFLKTLKQT